MRCVVIIVYHSNASLQKALLNCLESESLANVCQRGNKYQITTAGREEWKRIVASFDDKSGSNYAGWEYAATAAAASRELTDFHKAIASILPNISSRVVKGLQVIATTHFTIYIYLYIY